MRSFISLTFAASELPVGNEQGVIYMLSLYAFTSRERETFPSLFMRDLLLTPVSSERRK